MFGYQCQQCAVGKVMDQVFPQYKTRVNGKPAVIDNAHIGICGYCGAEHFDPIETLRWRSFAAGQHTSPAHDDHILAAWENEGGK